MVKLKYTGFITVRTSSSRLPNKCLLPFGDETVISHVIKRTINYGIEPIICTSLDASDDVLEDLSNELGVRCFRGSLVNKLKRWLDCAEEFDIERFHTIDADDPFFDGMQMIDSLKLLQSEQCDVVCPTKSSSSGGASVGYSLTTNVIRQALVGLACDTDTEMMWYYLGKVKAINSKILPDSGDANLNVRLTLDYEEDYWLLASIVRIVGKDATRGQISQFFVDNPDFSKINFFRNEEWARAQLAKKV